MERFYAKQAVIGLINKTIKNSIESGVVFDQNVPPEQRNVQAIANILTDFDANVNLGDQTFDAVLEELKTEIPKGVDRLIASGKREYKPVVHRLYCPSKTAFNNVQHNYSNSGLELIRQGDWVEFRLVSRPKDGTTPVSRSAQKWFDHLAALEKQVPTQTAATTVEKPTQSVKKLRLTIRDEDGNVVKDVELEPGAVITTM